MGYGLFPMWSLYGTIGNMSTENLRNIFNAARYAGQCGIIWRLYWDNKERKKDAPEGERPICDIKYFSNDRVCRTLIK
jgi:hypothetical protein